MLGLPSLSNRLGFGPGSYRMKFDSSINSYQYITAVDAGVAFSYRPRLYLYKKLKIFFL